MFHPHDGSIEMGRWSQFPVLVSGCEADDITKDGQGLLMQSGHRQGHAQFVHHLWVVRKRDASHPQYTRRLRRLHRGDRAGTARRVATDDQVRGDSEKFPQLPDRAPAARPPGRTGGGKPQAGS